MTRLKRTHSFVLLAIADGASHGSAIRDKASELSDGTVVLWPTTLYGSIRELLEAGLIEEAPGADATGDARRRSYRLTPGGRERLRHEAARMSAVAAQARSIADAS